jgi:hypothetical protein
VAANRIPILLALLCTQLDARNLSEVLEKVKSGASTEAAYTDLERIYSTDRWGTFPKFAETARYVAERLKAAGLERVETVNAPADGKTQVGWWTMPLAWNLRRARLEITNPQSPAAARVLADYETNPISVGMWSGPTPPGGIESEVVYVAGAKELKTADVRGKLVLTGTDPGGWKWLLARKGALGAINGFSENPALADDRHWVNSWGDRGWAFNAGDAPLPCFSITPRQADALRELLAKGPVRVRAEVDAEYSSGSYPYVTAVIPGETAEEVLALGHTAEIGAHDNATGVAAIIESARTLARLIRSGELAKPQRTIRVLLMPEIYGSMHYLVSDVPRARRTVAAICIDTPAASYELPGTEYTFHLNPHASASYTDAFILHLAREYFGSLTPPRPFHAAAHATGTDTFLADPLIGIPTVWPYSGTGVHSHHNSADRPETVDKRSLRDLVVVAAAYLYFIAAAGPQQAEWLAGIALHRATEELARAKSVGYTLERQVAAIESTKRLWPAIDNKRRIEELRRLARSTGSKEFAASRANDSAIPKRKRIGAITLDDLPHEKREGWPSTAWSLPQATALYWTDGKRTISEIVRLTELELGGDFRFDFSGYFRFLAKHGYIELLP